MTIERLRDIITVGESASVEFKSDESSPLSDRDLVEAVVCLANRDDDGPGLLIVGVEDDGRISGARPRHGGSTDPMRVQALIAGRTRPSHSTHAEPVAVDGAEILIITIPAARSPVGTADGRYLRRVIGGDGRPSCAPYHFHEMQSFRAGLGHFDYSALAIAGTSLEDIEDIEIARFRRAIAESQGRGDAALLDLADLDFLKAVGAIHESDGDLSVRSLGLLLFGSAAAIASAIPTHEVAFQEISGSRVLSNESWRWPLLRVAEEVMTRVMARNREQEFFVGLTRIAISDFPAAAVREGLANAFVHRDYTRNGAIHVQLRDDQLIIANPGGFPRGVRIDNLLSTAPVPRNLLLTDAFKRAGLVERTARGINSIFFESLRSGHGAPKYDRSTEVNVVLSLFGANPDTAFARLVAEELRDGNPLATEQLLILDALTRRPTLAPIEVARLIHRSVDESERVLASMRQSGLIESLPSNRELIFRLTTESTTRLGCLGHIGPGRIPRARFSELVVKHVERHGLITRRDAARICDLRQHQAYRLLNELVAAGKLLRVGSRGRAVHYIAPPPRVESDQIRPPGSGEDSA